MSKLFRHIRSHNQGVNEIVGTMLLLLISIGLFSVVYYSVLSVSEPVSTPSAYIIGRVNRNNNIIIEHYGGDSLDDETTFYLTVGSEQRSFTISEYLIDKNSNNKWDIGEQVIIDDLAPTNAYVHIDIVDSLSSSLVMSGIIQDGGKTPQPYVVTEDAYNVDKFSAELSMSYNFIWESGHIWFEYKKLELIGMDGGWTQTTPESKSGYGTYTQEINSLTFNTTYMCRANLEYDSVTLKGEIKQFSTKDIDLDTRVDPITPYYHSESPLRITASGDSDLENVTLYYRFSTDNLSIVVFNAIDKDNLNLVYEKPFIEYLRNEDFDVRVISDDEVHLYDYSNVDLLIIRSPEGKWEQHPQESNLANLEVNIISMCRRVSLNGLSMTGWTYAYSGIMSHQMRPRSSTHPFCEGYDTGTWYTVYTSESGSVDVIESLTLGTTAQWRTLGTSRMTVAQRTETINEKNYDRIHWGAHQGDILTEDGWNIFANVIGEYLNTAPWNIWEDSDNPDETSPWEWEFDFPNDTGYYTFYSIGAHDGDYESMKNEAEAMCKFEE
ncbi:MAG: type IV pilin N-terminal domain-containing protein [Candidatus Thermoplasmatota archaeon]|nr:type IV pilin N-terminal domain-containing protein [Candidatus Thermoplasmatota archaeon]